MSRLSILSVLAALSLAAVPSFACADDVVPSRRDDWRGQMLVPSDDAQGREIFLLISGRPMSDNPTIVPWLEENEAHLPPMFTFDLSRRLFADDRDSALEWFAVARLRLAYDARRCADPSVVGDGLAISMLARRLSDSVAGYAQKHPDEYLAAELRAQARNDLFEYDASPKWVCAFGLSAYGQSLGLGRGEPREPVKAKSEWPGIEAKLREELDQSVGRLQKAIAEASAPDAPPSRVPAAVLSGSTEDKIKAIGAAARVAALRLAAIHHSASQLLLLADAQIKAGDKEGAQETIAVAQPHTKEARDSMRSFERGESIRLWVRAGDLTRARALLRDGPDAPPQIGALDTYGVALAQSGDTAGARATLALVEQAAVETTDERASTGQREVEEFGGRQLDFAFRDIGVALADAGDFHGALSAAEKLLEGFLRAGLLAGIASRQCASGDPDAGVILRSAQTAVHAVEQKWLVDAAEDIAYALAACESAADALAVAQELAPGSVNDVLERVAQQLTEHRDYAHAAHIDKALAPRIHDLGSVIALAQRQIARDKVSGARANLAVASAQIRRAAVSPIDPVKAYDTSNLLTSIIDLQIKAGDFFGAVVSAEPLDRNYRPQVLVRVIEEAAKRHDADALRQALAMVTQKIQEADLLPARATALAGIAKALGRAGYIDQARQTLAPLQELARHGIGGPYPQQIFVQIAEAQAAMGDVAGARATSESVDGPWRESALSGLAREACLANDFATARAIAEEINDRYPTLEHIAASEAKAGDISAAMATAWQITEWTVRADALLELLKAAHVP
jgi:tetratricopeptide (TPR) repeat protein